MFATLVLVHHVATIEDLIAELECLVVSLPVESFLLLGVKFVLGHTTGGMGAWECVNVR